MAKSEEFDFFRHFLNFAAFDLLPIQAEIVNELLNWIEVLS